MNLTHNQDLGDKVTGSQNTEAELSDNDESASNITHNSQYNKQAMSNVLNNNNNSINMQDLKALRASLINGEEKVSSEEIVYKIDNFFIDDNPFGITLKEDLKKVIKETNDYGFEGLVQFFKYVFERRRFRLSTVLKDRTGKPYYWGTVRDGMCDIGFKIPIFPGIDRILKSREKVAMYITMEEIIEKLK